jgi:hypothetical protein
MDIGLFGFSATWSLDYIEIPVLARFQIPVWGRAKPFVYAGPAIGFNVRSNIGASYEDEEIGSENLEDYTTSVDFSAAIGAGIYIPLAGQEISFEFRYVPGFSNVYTDDLEDQGVSIEQFNDTFSFLFGYEF